MANMICLRSTDLVKEWGDGSDFGGKPVYLRELEEILGI